ncbi:MAG: nucleotidyltransferase family protein [Candidatus Liptonbacteria bacterium]|nr:nucleotidyltransferase family protein [Candidatus Liptonbacteria bacterium]
MQATIEELKQKALPILRAAGVTRSAVFGSFARGESGAASDIDILIEVGKEKSLLDLVELKLQLEEALKQKVDLVEYHTLKPRLRERILGEQMPIL